MRIRTRFQGTVLLTAMTATLAVAGPPTTGEGKPNRLINERSPYLLQHAYNPVAWYPWGPEAFAAAREQGLRLVGRLGGLYAAATAGQSGVLQGGPNSRRALGLLGMRRTRVVLFEPRIQNQPNVAHRSPSRWPRQASRLTFPICCAPMDSGLPTASPTPR